MYETWNRIGLLLFIIGITSYFNWAGDTWLFEFFTMGVAMIGALLFIMPKNYYEKKGQK